MTLGLTWEKLVLILVIAALLIGPERLPRYAEGLAHLVGRVRDYLRGAKTRVKDELGEDFDDVDWRTLDPRRYDPRRIIREALLDDAPLPTIPSGIKPQSPGGPVPTTVVGAAGAAGAGASAASVADAPPARPAFRPDDDAPFDSEAT